MTSYRKLIDTFKTLAVLSTVGGQKKLGHAKFLTFVSSFNCQNKVKIKLTFTNTVDSYLVRYNAKSNRITKPRN
jgi:hypothetical protein